MSIKEKYIGEAKIKEQPKKKLSLKIADNAVTSRTIANGAVGTSKIADNAITTDKIGDGQVKTNDIADKNVTTPKLADGAVTLSKLAPDVIVLTNSITMEGNIKQVRFGHTATLVLNLSTTNALTGSWKIIKNGNETFTHEGNTWRFENEVDGKSTFSIECVQGERKYTKEYVVEEAYPYYGGGGNSWDEIATSSHELGIVTPNGDISNQYTIVVPQDGQKIWLIVPSSVAVSSIKMGGIEVPKNMATQNITLQEGVKTKTIEYKIYSSVNTYNAGTYSIQVNEYEGADKALIEELINEVRKLPNTHIRADEEDIELVETNNSDGTKNGVIQLKDKAYSPANFSGLGRKYLRKNIVNGKNVLTAGMMNKANTIYHIQYDFDLDGANITVPAGCILEFEGGSIDGGTINLNGCYLSGDVRLYSEPAWNEENEFYEDYKPSNGTLNVSWFGAKADGQHDDAPAIRRAIKWLHKDGGTLVFDKVGTYILGDGIQDFVNDPNKTLHTGYSYPEDHPCLSSSGMSNYPASDAGNAALKQYIIANPADIGRDIRLFFFRFTNLIIEGNGSTVKSHDNNGYCFHNGIFQIYGCDNLTIRNLTIDGNREGRPVCLDANRSTSASHYRSDYSVGGLILASVRNADSLCDLENLTRDDWRGMVGVERKKCSGFREGTSFQLYDCQNVLIENVNSYGSLQDGINLYGDLTCDVRNIEIRNCRFEYNSRQGITISSVNNVLIENCIFDNAGYLRDPDTYVHHTACHHIDAEADAYHAANRDVDQGYRQKDIVIRKCTFGRVPPMENKAPGVTITYYTTNSIIEDCTFNSCNLNLTDRTGCLNNTVRNCRITNGFVALGQEGSKILNNEIHTILRPGLPQYYSIGHLGRLSSVPLEIIGNKFSITYTQEPKNDPNDPEHKFYSVFRLEENAIVRDNTFVDYHTTSILVFTCAEFTNNRFTGNVYTGNELGYPAIYPLNAFSKTLHQPAASGSRQVSSYIFGDRNLYSFSINFNSGVPSAIDNLGGRYVKIYVANRTVSKIHLKCDEVSRVYTINRRVRGAKAYFQDEYLHSVSLPMYYTSYDDFVYIDIQNLFNRGPITLSIQVDTMYEGRSSILVFSKTPPAFTQSTSIQMCQNFSGVVNTLTNYYAGSETNDQVITPEDFQGHPVFVKDVNHLVVSNGERLVDVYGFSRGLKVGYFNKKPTSSLQFSDDGYSYFATELGKEIHLHYNSTDGRLIGQLDNPGSSSNTSAQTVPGFFENTLAGGETYRFRITEFETLPTLYFTKGEDELDEPIPVELNAISDGYGMNGVCESVIIVTPDPTVYTKICLKLTSWTFSRKASLYGYTVDKRWVEADGAKAGVLRSGTFANKPAGADIYVGFKYFCTDKHTPEAAPEGSTEQEIAAANGIEIIYKGNDTWVDALGRVIS